MKTTFAYLFAFIAFNGLSIPFYFPDKWVKIGDTHAVFYGWFNVWAAIVVFTFSFLAFLKLYSIGEKLFDYITENN